jgi:SAM-dependent methyltransferase
MMQGADMRTQIKTRDRVRKLAEVYTHEREVGAMLDLIPEMFPPSVRGADIKFLEPGCGSGNFLEEVLRRKLLNIRFTAIRSVSAYEHRILRAVASIYGVDISPDNVAEARARIVSEVRAHYYNDANTMEPTYGFVSALGAILATNILKADFLNDAATTEVIDYRAIRGGYFVRVWSTLDDSVAIETEPDLFHQEPAEKRDEIPVHYADLAVTPRPTREEPSASSAPQTA